MSIAIGSSSLSCAVGGQPSRASLDADLARYQKQLSDSVNCASSKTLEGKTHIQELSNKISSTQERIQQVEAAKPPADAPVISNAAPTAASDTYTNDGAPAKSATSDPGTRVNIFA